MLLVLAGVDGFSLIYVAVIAIALIYAGSILLKKNKRPREDQITTLASRGDWETIVIGTHRVGPLFGWAGDRFSKTSGGGSKGGFLGGGKGTASWYEGGWHHLGIGSGDAILDIFQNGTSLMLQPGQTVPTPILAEETPSGSVIDMPNGEGSFAVYWGGQTQPVNYHLGAPSRVGVASRWPFLIYADWTVKKLGASPTWGALEYVIRCGCPTTSLSDSDFWLDDGTSKGVNGAHALHMILTAPYPVGKGFPPGILDHDSLEALGVLAQAEHIPMNLKYQAGVGVDQCIAEILQDLGCAMPLVDKRLTFIPIRSSTADVPSLGDDLVVAPDIEQAIDRGDNPISRMVFVFKDETNRTYRDADIPFDDDAEFNEQGSVEPQTVSINTVTHPAVAAKVARRRSQEATIDNGSVLSVLRAARLLVPGQVFERPGLGRFRVIGSERLDDSPAGRLSCILDTLGVPDIPDGFPGTGGSQGPLAALPDIAFLPLELPAEITPDVAITVLRIRAHPQMQGANIWVSPDDTTYSLAGTQNIAGAGGLIDANIAAVTSDIITAGPSFEADNSDAAEILDLSGDETSWMAGRQVAVIGSEVFYLQSVTLQLEALWEPSTGYTTGDYVIPSTPTGLRYKATTSGTTGTSPPAWPVTAGGTVVDGGVHWEAHNFVYAMNNLIRARLGSVAAAHTAGDRVFIADRTTLSIIRHPIIQPGQLVWVKTQPYSSRALVDLAVVTPVTVLISGIVVTDTLRVTDSGAYRVTGTGDLRIVSE